MIFGKRLIRSFRHAINGLLYLAKYERNFKIHLTILLLITAVGLYLKFSLIEFSLVVLASALVLITEAINSGIEIILDIIYPQHNGKSKIIKDALAGAVLISAIAAIIIGIIIFTHHFGS